MLSLTQTFRTRRFVFLAFSVLAAGAIVGAVVGSTGKAPLFFKTQTSDPIVTSRTSSVRVVGVERITGDMPILKVRLQNLSTKNIKTYMLSSGKSGITKDFSFTELFAPNAIDMEMIPLSAPNFGGSIKEFAITAVLFEDDTADGEGIPVFWLKERHDGLRDQGARLLSCLQRTSSSSTQLEQDLSLCESEAKRLSLKGRSPGYEEGLQQAQQDFLLRLDEMKNKAHTNDLTEAVKQRNQTIRILQKLVHRKE